MNPANETNTINYDSLSSLRHSVFRISSPSLAIMFAFFGVILGLVGLSNISNLNPEQNFVWILLVAAVLTVGIVVYLMIMHERLVRHNEKILGAFAAANNMTYQPSDENISSRGTLFEQGGSKRRQHIFSGTVRSMPFQGYGYYFETGSGKNRRTHDAMVLEITLPRVVPQFVIDSQLENVIPIIFDKSQKIELEGDFHKYFDLYAPDTYGVSALTLLAPDTMEVLMERAALCDIEVVQDKLFFYWPAPARTKAQYEEIFSTVNAVLTKLGKKLTQDDIYATKSQARIHAEPNGQGVRLKRSRIGVLTVAIIIMYFAAQFAEHTSFAGLGGIFMTVVWVGVVGWIFYTAARQSKLKQEYLQRYKTKY